MQKSGRTAEERFSRLFLALMLGAGLVLVPSEPHAKAADEAVGWLRSDYIWRYEFSGEDYAGTCTPGRCEEKYVGRVRLFAEISLNGSWSSWEQRIQVLDGAPISATLQWNCYQDRGVRPNVPCEGSQGWHRSDSNEFVRDHSIRWGAMHRQDDTYGYDFRFSWRRPGHSRVWGTTELHSFRFVCKQEERPAACKFIT